MSSSPVTSPYLPSRRATMAGGQPISELMSRALDNPSLISLAAGFVDQETLPVDCFRDVMIGLMEDECKSRTMLQYGATPGLTSLRESILDLFTSATDPSELLDRVLITAGSNQLLHLVAETLLDPGDIVLCAAPTYLVFLGTIANLGGRTWSVATDENGIIPEELEATLQQIDDAGELHRVKAIYLVPYFDNPSGITMPVERVQKVVEIAKRWSEKARIHVIADEAYRELRYSGDDTPSAWDFDEDGETVIVAGTFSKSFSPGLRTGWGILPKHLVEPVQAMKGNIDFGSPNMAQHVLAEVLRRDLFTSHVNKLRASYSAKLDSMLAAMEESLSPLEGVTWLVPTGGLYVWATLPSSIDTGPNGKLFEQAIEEGVMYVPGQYCYPAEGQPIARNQMRLSFGVQSCERIREGIAALARAIQDVS